MTKIIQVYKCFCDELRLRILNVLQDGPLCVCHLVEIFDADQVKVSKQLRYMKELGMVASERAAQWMVYRLAEPDHPLLVENLRCIQDCAGEPMGFAADRAKRDAILERLSAECTPCPEAVLACASGDRGGLSRRPRTHVIIFPLHIP